MPASALNAMAPTARLTGACCSPVNYQSYVGQPRELSRRYASVDVIPKDPYGVPVSLAKRLLGYRSISLTPAQQRIYNHAKPLSDTKASVECHSQLVDPGGPWASVRSAWPHREHDAALDADSSLRLREQVRDASARSRRECLAA